MSTSGHTRRSFLARCGGAWAAAALRNPLSWGQTVSAARASVADMERDRVLAAAKQALTQPSVTLDTEDAPHGEPGQFYSEVEPEHATSKTPTASAKPLFRAHARLLREASAQVALLTAAFVLTGEEPYGRKAADHLRAWFLTPGTRMRPAFDLAGCTPQQPEATPAGMLDLVPLAEIARSMAFLTDCKTWDPEELDALHTWTDDALAWMETNRTAGLARDSRDHRSSAWLLIGAAMARWDRDSKRLEALRKRFRAPTLRNQIRPDGVFPQEVATPNPFRNTLYNFDLLGGACQLLASPFDLLWDFELIEGVGMRVVAAYLYPFLAHPERWPFIADAESFRELPGRRPALLFAGRAYNRPEYVELWRSQPDTPPPADLAGTFPIREPLLWVAKAPHGF